MVLQLVVRTDYTAVSGGPGYNVWHWDEDPGSSDDVNVEQASGRLQAFYQALTEYMRTSTTISLQPDIIRLDSTDLLAADTWTLTGDDASSSQSLPPATALCLTFRTAVRSRRGRGRKFLSPFSTVASEANGTPGEGFRQNVDAAAGANLVLPGDSVDGGFGVYSSADGLIRRYTAAIVPNEWAVLRSRRD